MHATVDCDTYSVLEQLEDINFRITVDEPGAVVLRTALNYDLHVRPATHIFGKLSEAGLVEKLSLKRAYSDVWVDFQPLSLVAMAIHRGEEIDIRVRAPVTKPILTIVIEAFRSCPLYRDYSARPERPATANDVVMADTSEFQREFESENKGFSLIKLNIENFIIGHLAEIEAYVIRHTPRTALSWDCLHESFKRLLFGEFENFGILSLDVPLDNLMQTRDMCYHLHFKQMERRRKIPYSVFGIEWGREFGLSWRRKQTQRHRYFYERESDYYRDLFLVMVLRERGRLDRYVSQWRARLDYSLRLRRNLPHEIGRFEHEMENFSPNFENPEEFRNHIHLMGEMAIKDISRLTPYLELVLEGRICRSETNEMPFSGSKLPVEPVP